MMTSKEIKTNMGRYQLAKPFVLTGFVFLSLLFISCKKDWLEAKAIQSQLIPDNIKDLQLTLDNTDYFNVDLVGLNESGTNDFYLANTYFQSLNEANRNTYSWASVTPGSFYGVSSAFDWANSYRALFVANTVLENIEKIARDANNKTDWDNIKGSALFYRSWICFHLAQVFCKPYTTSANSDLGIILRLSPDVYLPSQRATVQKTYEQIIADLLASEPLLPATPFNGWKTRPTKPAVFAMLARVYLAMQNYDKAREYADRCLAINGMLMNFNTDPSINNTSPYPFAKYNAEVLFHSLLNAVPMMPQVTLNGYVDSTLYSLYSDSDLRKSFYFEKVNGVRLAFGGGYDGGNNPGQNSPSIFNGLATDEVYLVKAECQARRADVAGAMETLNFLYERRWNNTTGPYQPITASDSVTALRKIFLERRKELCFRGIRWTDLRRLNQDSRFAETLIRGLLNSSTTFTLSPNDDRYVYPIPQDEILFSGVQQNPR